MKPFWISHSGIDLAQGDFLPECLVPIVPKQIGPDFKPIDLKIRSINLIVMSQSCDLINSKTDIVALCPIYTFPVFESINPSFTKKGTWEEVRKGRREGLYLLASPTDPTNGRAALVVDFREIFSLPIGYLQHHAASMGSRWRLDSPFLEHFSQAFARFFMRVGLPSSIPPIVD